jgi:hypothetical protein
MSAAPCADSDPAKGDVTDLTGNDKSQVLWAKDRLIERTSAMDNDVIVCHIDPLYA